MSNLWLTIKPNNHPHKINSVNSSHNLLHKEIIYHQQYCDSPPSLSPFSFSYWSRYWLKYRSVLNPPKTSGFSIAFFLSIFSKSSIAGLAAQKFTAIAGAAYGNEVPHPFKLFRLGWWFFRFMFIHGRFAHICIHSWKIWVLLLQITLT